MQILFRTVVVKGMQLLEMLQMILPCTQSMLAHDLLHGANNGYAMPFRTTGHKLGCCQHSAMVDDPILHLMTRATSQLAAPASCRKLVMCGLLSKPMLQSQVPDANKRCSKLSVGSYAQPAQLAP